MENMNCEYEHHNITKNFTMFPKHTYLKCSTEKSFKLRHATVVAS